MAYVTSATTKGGRNGRAMLDNGALALAMAAPKEIGGAGDGHNPEQLFALGYSSCYGQAILLIAKKYGLDGQAARVTCEVTLDQKDGGFALAVELKVSIPGAEKEKLQQLAEEASRFGQAVLELIENLGKPVVAAINGFALGAGCETAMACTIRIAVENAKFGQPEVALGLLPGGGGTQRLPRLVGKGRALQLILSGEMISAQEAYRIGLVNEIVPATDLITRAEAILNKIASNAPVAVKFSLEAVNKGLETSQGEGLLLEASYFGLCAGTEDKKEGTSAFLEKRVPQFQGR